jgi:hypothetical protein
VLLSEVFDCQTEVQLQKAGGVDFFTTRLYVVVESVDDLLSLCAISV